MEPLVGIQIGAISFADEGVAQVLGRLRDLASVNALFVATQSFDRGVQGRQIAGRPWPGHGGQERDDHNGGSYVTQHPEFYRGTVLEPFAATDREVAGQDVLEQVLPEASRHGMKVYSFVLENTHSGLTRSVPNWPKVLQVDAWGRRDSHACVRNPDYVTWWLSLVEDQVKSYPLDGLMFGSERNGPLGNVLGDGGFARDGRPYCFCPHCERAGRDRGIDPARAREGYLALYRLAHGESDPDGDSGLVSFLRLLLTYPEIAAWERLPGRMGSGAGAARRRDPRPAQRVPVPAHRRRHRRRRAEVLRPDGRRGALGAGRRPPAPPAHPTRAITTRGGSIRDVP